MILQNNRPVGKAMGVRGVLRRLYGWPTLYLVLIISLYIVYVAVAFSAILSSSSAPNPSWLVFGAVVGIPIADRLSGMLLFLVARNAAVPPRLASLQTRPRVALLYCTRDDAVLECLTLLKYQRYDNLDIFIMDDSETEYYRELTNSSGYTIVRRPDRQGFKAGNINYWLRNWGKLFDYFVILDADSVLPPDFVEQMLMYGEHPENSHIALFESRILGWAPTSALQQAQAVQLEMASNASIRLSNRLGVTLSNGHNNLCRTSHLISVGGFDERYVSEDQATTLNLIALGLSCYIVDVTSYEIVPPSLSALKRRTRRWVRNDLQLMSHPWTNV
jgi:hypothetical protein